MSQEVSAPSSAPPPPSAADTTTSMSDAAAATSNSNDTKKPTKQQQQSKEDKVKIHFVAVGSAPHMKKTKFQIGAQQPFAAVHAFLRRILKLPASSALFLYCSSAFCPGPTELVGDLRDCFAVRDELVIHYSLQEAWG